MLKGIRTLRILVSKQTQIDHLCQQSLVVIKKRKAKIWADQIYLGQAISLHILMGSLSATSCLE